MNNKENPCDRCVVTELTLARLKEDAAKDSCKFWKAIAILSLGLNGGAIGCIIARAIL